MISNQVLQSTIDGLKAITRVDLCVLGTDGEILAATLLPGAESTEAVLAFVDSPADSQTLAGYQFFKVYDDNHLEFVILAKGDTDDVYMIG
ncbi:MAG: PucR family transcriptional regulator, partial [Lachnospiraceae bacterium]